MFFRKNPPFNLNAFDEVKGHCARFLRATNLILRSENLGDYDKKAIFFNELKSDTLRKIGVFEEIFKTYGIVFDFTEPKENIDTINYEKLVTLLNHIEETAAEAYGKTEEESCCSWLGF